MTAANNFQRLKSPFTALRNAARGPLVCVRHAAESPVETGLPSTAAVRVSSPEACTALAVRPKTCLRRGRTAAPGPLVCALMLSLCAGGCCFSELAGEVVLMLARVEWKVLGCWGQIHGDQRKRRQ